MHPVFIVSLLHCVRNFVLQILMSVTPVMEDVNSCAITPLAASTAIVTLATCWM